MCERPSRPPSLRHLALSVFCVVLFLILTTLIGMLWYYTVALTRVSGMTCEVEHLLSSLLDVRYGLEHSVCLGVLFGLVLFCSLLIGLFGFVLLRTECSLSLSATSPLQ